MGVERIKAHRTLCNEQRLVNSTVAKKYFGLRNVQNNENVVKCGKLGRILKPVVVAPNTWDIAQLDPIKTQLSTTVLPVLTSAFEVDHIAINKHIQSLSAFTAVTRSQIQQLVSKQNHLTAELRLCRCNPVIERELINTSSKSILLEDLAKVSEDVDELLGKLQDRVNNAEKIPVEPGFEFSIRNITQLLKQKEAELEKTRQLVTQLSSL